MMKIFYLTPSERERFTRIPENGIGFHIVNGFVKSCYIGTFGKFLILNCEIVIPFHELISYFCFENLEKNMESLEKFPKEYCEIRERK